MSEKWRIIRNRDGSILVFDGIKVVLLRADGITGYGFVRDYLRETGKHYRNHLMATDLLLQRLLADKYSNVRRVSNVYHSYLAILSLCCRFGGDCSVSSSCPFNGFHSSNKDKLMVGCNPIYELPMTPTQARVAGLLVNTAYSLSDIAEVLCISESRVRSLASIVYATIGVENRQELVILLQGKRIS